MVVLLFFSATDELSDESSGEEATVVCMCLCVLCVLCVHECVCTCVCCVVFCACAYMYIVYVLRFVLCGVHVVCMHVAGLHVHQYCVWMCICHRNTLRLEKGMAH